MKILQITNKVPFPALEGGSIAMNVITQGLIRSGHMVKVLAMNTPKYNVETDMLPADYKKSTRIETVFLDTRVKPVDALMNLLFSKESYNIARFISKEFETKLTDILKKEKFDIIQLEMLFVTPYIEVIRKYSDAKIILRAHNVEHFIWERMAANCRNPLKKFYLNILAKRLKIFETEQINKVDGIAAISQQDAEYLKQSGCRVPLIDIPVAVDNIEIDKRNSTIEFPSLFHLGSMNWMPNIEGIQWFLDNVWERVNKKYPYLKLYLAGRNMPEWMLQLKLPNVVVLGEVENASDFLLSKSVMIVPLLSGSGMRVKIIEGLTFGKAIISTTIGAEGIECEHGKNILIADTPDEFIRMIDVCISDENFCKTLGENARQLIMEKYNNAVVTQKLVGFYTSIIETYHG
ncbi:MAG: glycosyltransferase [Bacteroidia bacterium]|nr:glycosyltransferase [Bacteroidia bacterium]